LVQYVGSLQALIPVVVLNLAGLKDLPGLAVVITAPYMTTHFSKNYPNYCRQNLQKSVIINTHFKEITVQIQLINF
jgi:hypothetical protein